MYKGSLFGPGFPPVAGFAPLPHSSLSQTPTAPRPTKVKAKGNVRKRFSGQS
jgi:hypothetical protein